MLHRAVSVGERRWKRCVEVIWDDISKFDTVLFGCVIGEASVLLGFVRVFPVLIKNVSVVALEEELNGKEQNDFSGHFVLELLLTVFHVLEFCLIEGLIFRGVDLVADLVRDVLLVSCANHPSFQ